MSKSSSQQPAASGYHKPVMLQQCIDALQIQAEGIYVDVTFGGGGHTAEILKYIKGGRLIAFDQDEDAKREAEKINSSSFTFCQANFMYMKKYLKLNGVTKVNGILADLGMIQTTIGVFLDDRHIGTAWGHYVLPYICFGTVIPSKSKP